MIAWECTRLLWDGTPSVELKAEEPAAYSSWLQGQESPVNSLFPDLTWSVTLLTLKACFLVCNILPSQPGL